MKQELRQKPFPGCFILFGGSHHYPLGGIDDILGFGEKQELEEWFLLNQGYNEWAHVVSYDTMKTVSAIQEKAVLNKADGTVACFDRRFVDQ